PRWAPPRTRTWPAPRRSSARRKRSCRCSTCRRTPIPTASPCCWASSPARWTSTSRRRRSSRSTPCCRSAPPATCWRAAPTCASPNANTPPPTRAWSITPSITWSGLNVQRVRSELHAAEARADAAQANYQRTVLEAIEDVDNAVVGYNLQHDRVEKLMAQVQQSRRAAELAKVRYEQGATGYLELLDAERVQLAADDALAQAQAAIDT